MVTQFKATSREVLRGGTESRAFGGELRGLLNSPPPTDEPLSAARGVCLGALLGAMLWCLGLAVLGAVRGW